MELHFKRGKSLSFLMEKKVMALTISNAYLTTAQMAGNAQYIVDYLLPHGWTKNALAGTLGNMERESNINPGLWQSLKYGNMSGGYGLVQWTPATNYINWANSEGFPWGNSYSNPTSYINGQLERILWELENNQQWIATSAFNFSFSTYIKSTASPEYLAEAFLKNYERAGTEALGQRQTAARYWFDNLTYGDDGSTEAINKAIEWAVGIANDDTHGYDQGSRWGPDYDCASLMIQAWQNAGVPVKTNGASFTGDMYKVFVKCGFNDVTSQVNMATGSGLKRGDVMLKPAPKGHTGMYIGDGMMVHASINENNQTEGGKTGDQTGQEICTRSYYNKPWTYILRYKSGGSGGVTPKNVSLVNWIPA